MNLLRKAKELENARDTKSLTIIALFPCLLFVTSGFAQTKKTQLHIIPQPVSATVQEGYFNFNSKTKILYNKKSVDEVAEFFIQKMNKSTGYHYTAIHSIHWKRNCIFFQINKKEDSALGKEGYTLHVSPKSIVIAANQPNGLFYGMQTLFQLMPSQIEKDTLTKNISWVAPCVRITDYPKFKWRGLMLDVSRHFFSGEFVEKYIDEMAKYKYNVFHWHLTDDQGWRIQIKGLPKLTEVGAWRVPRVGKWNGVEYPQPGEKTTDGGFYTQQDIKDIIQYAKKRFVMVLPEIDVPAHSLSLIASYPDLSCTKLQYPVFPGAAPRSMDNVLCVANDSTWMILDKIFTQVAQLFPCPYIHVGGDEANRKFWTEDPKDIALMKKEVIQSPAGLQSYFEKKLEKIIISKGKKMIGWDEILEGGLAPEATVMSWHGLKGGVKAAKMGHHVIMSPYGSMYLRKNEQLKIKLSVAMSGLKIYYRFDGTNPDNFSPEYKGQPLSVPQGASEIKVITYQNGKPVGRQMNCPIDWLKKRMEK